MGTKIIKGKEITDTNWIEPTLHNNDFYKWVRQKKIQIYDRLSDVVKNPQTQMVKGQRCAVINGYNLLLHGYTIMGFCKPDKYGNCVLLNWDCYWFPKHPADIILEK